MMIVPLQITPITVNEVIETISSSSIYIVHPRICILFNSQLESIVSTSRRSLVRCRVRRDISVFKLRLHCFIMGQYCLHFFLVLFSDTHTHTRTVCLSVCVSVSLTHTHTPQHTHTVCHTHVPQHTHSLSYTHTCNTHTVCLSHTHTRNTHSTRTTTHTVCHTHTQ